MIVGPGIEFDAATHTYRVEGRVVMSVTQVLEKAGISDFSMVPARVLKHAAERGTAVHRAIHYEMENDLDESTIDPLILPYLNAQRAFMKDSGLQPRRIEHVVYCEEFDYIGTLDVEGIYPGTGDVIADWKSGAKARSWAIQIAAYVRACVGKYRCHAHKRLAVQLKKTGRYELHWYPQHAFDSDWEQFRNALEVCRKVAA